MIVPTLSVGMQARDALRLDYDAEHRELAST